MKRFPPHSSSARRSPFIVAAALFSLTAMTSIAPAQVAPVPTVTTFATADVKLLDGPFNDAMRRNADYLLSLEADRFLHNTRKYCGLEPKGELYGGWEARGIAGHSLGHYLTAISLQYAATGDKRFRDRIDYIIKEMAECQTRYGDGYIGALPPLELETLRGLKTGKLELQGGFNFKGGAWVPWYTQHKVLAGLKDAWVLGGNPQAKDVTLKLADFVDDATKNLSPAQQQTMLGVEFGGMSETLVELYELTGEKRYLDVSKRFYHHKVLDPLLAGRDELPGKHANTQVPKIIGEAVRYEATGDANSRKISEYFWNLVVDQYTWAIGGNSDHEHFFPANKAADHLGPQAAESCNTYNMLKLTEHLFSWQPKVEYGDYFERALYNQILPSQEPEHGMFTYFVSLKPGHFRTYSSPTNSFWCCVGSGMENHTKYNEAIYFHNDRELYVNLFMPSELTWKDKSLVLEQRTKYPEAETTELTIKAAPTSPVTVLVRCPAWAIGPVKFTLNGKPLNVDGKPGTFAKIEQTWAAGDVLGVTLPMGVRTESLHGAPNKVAFLYGPLVLAGDLGVVPRNTNYPIAGDHIVNDRARTADVPVLVANDLESIAATLERVPGDTLAFRTKGAGRPIDATLRPFNAMPYNYYNVYWDVFTVAEWSKREAAVKAADQKRRDNQARVVDEVNPGEQQSETDHSVKGENSVTGDAFARHWRDARDGGFFEYTVKVDAGKPQLLRCTYAGGDFDRSFRILIDGQLLATQKLERSAKSEVFDIDYKIPPNLIAGKQKVVVRFESVNRKTAGGLYYVAVMRAP